MTFPGLRVLNFRSLRFRFMFAAFLWVSITAVIAGVAISLLYRNHVTAQFREELRIHTIELVGLTTVDHFGNPTLYRLLSDPRFEDVGSGFYWQIDRPGKKVLKSPTLVGDARLGGVTAVSSQERFAWTQGPVSEVLEWGTLRVPEDGDPAIRYSVAADRRLVEAVLASFNRDLAASLAVFVLLMVVGAMLQIRYGLGPVARIANDVESLRQGKRARLATDVPEEFSALVKRLNALLDAQAALVQRARVETGNLAHGLRTPLALIGDETDQLAQRGENESAAFILAQSRKIGRHVDYHMKRASAAGTRVTGYVADIAVLVRQIISAMERLHAEKALAFDIDIPAGLNVNCDEGDLSEIVSNLIDNACKWAASHLVIAARRDEGAVVVSIMDDGPGIDPALRAQVFDVGTRLDENKAGSGLGLAISRDLARLYGGDLELSDAPAGGLLARLTLPEAAPL